MAFGIGSALSLGGSLLGALGGGKQKAGAPAVSGYQSLPQEIKDYLLKDLFPQMKSYQSSGYQGIPLRRLNASDTDPVFGSKARQDIQAWRDYMLAQKPEAEADDSMDKEKELADMEARMLARQYLQGQGGKKGYGWMVPELYDDAGLAGVGKFVMAANKAGGGDMGFVDARSMNPSAAEGFDKANVAMMLEAMRRKGMA